MKQLWPFTPPKEGLSEPFNFHFDTMKVSLGLEIIITLPDGEAGKLKEHEEGHRKIAEYFYSIGPQATHLAGKTLTDDELLAYESNSDSATPDVFLKTRISNFISEYLKHTQEICAQANEYYDQLTNHGKNNVDSDQAAQMAISRYAQ